MKSNAVIAHSERSDPLHRKLGGAGEIAEPVTVRLSSTPPRTEPLMFFARECQDSSFLIAQDLAKGHRFLRQWR